MTVLSRVKPLPQWYKDYYHKANADPGLLEHGGVNGDSSVSQDAHHKLNGKKCSKYLYHVLLTTSHIPKDPNQIVEKIRMIGSYDNLKKAKVAAHRALFDAGYEAEFFKEYGITAWSFEQQHVVEKARHGLMINAVAQDDTIFQVRLSTTPNDGGFVSELEDGRICQDLYYVVQTIMDYRDGSQGERIREHIVQQCCENYNEARRTAFGVLLDEQDGLTRSSYEQYDEAGPDDLDCGFGTNVIVHAVGKNGENYMISVIKGHVLESVRLMEATMRLR